MTATAVAPDKPSEGSASQNTGTPAGLDTKSTSTPDPAQPATGQPPAAEAKPAEGAKPQAEQLAGLVNPDAKPAEAKPEAAKPKNAPEKYGEFKVPEGTDPLAPEVVTALTGVAKELDLSQDGVQSLINKVMPTMRASAKAQHEALVKGWADQLAHDKELGGDNLKANLATAQKAFDAATTPEFRAMAKNTGLVHNPDFVRLFKWIGDRISDDRFVGGGSSERVPADPAKRVYPNMS